MTKSDDPSSLRAEPERRTPLDRAQVVRAAIELIDEHGAHALSMRRLGRRLNVEAMSLYKHVDSRDTLLDGVIAAIIDELFDDPETHLRETDSWSDYLVRVAHGVRRNALAHPNVFPLVATRPPEAPWIRPPLRSLPWVESFLLSLRTHGFDADAAVYTYRAFTSFLLGHLLLEVAALGADTGPIASPESTHPSGLRLDDYPNVQELRPKLTENAAAEEFDESLDNLLNRLQDVRTHGLL
ncbi:MAG TPA: TetR/AcrR family transcriptional regulator C-terminal domain-containing protein [Mycobacteriales bacterium]|nr:TetR/AcrR family transcriptional regulator C-terminal domain-containing protein [Mycobacteriales bacterium]